MQIFGLKKKKILKIILSGYLLKILTSFALSIVIYGIGVWVYFIVFNSIVFLNYIYTAAIIFSIFIIYLLAIYISILRFMKKDIIKLITDKCIFIKEVFSVGSKEKVDKLTAELKDDGSYRLG